MINWAIWPLPARSRRRSAADYHVAEEMNAGVYPGVISPMLTAGDVEPMATAPRTSPVSTSHPEEIALLTASSAQDLPDS
jgi:hypothetical protein